MKIEKILFSSKQLKIPYNPGQKLLDWLANCSLFEKIRSPPPTVNVDMLVSTHFESWYFGIFQKTNIALGVGGSDNIIGVKLQF